MSSGERSCNRFGNCDYEPPHESQKQGDCYRSHCTVNCPEYKWDEKTPPDSNTYRDIREHYQKLLAEEEAERQENMKGKMPITGRCRNHTWQNTESGRICIACGKKQKNRKRR